MPLLGKKPFPLIEAPDDADLKSGDLYQIRFTKEIFTKFEYKQVYRLTKGLLQKNGLISSENLDVQVF
jgi:hypothetical protein